MGRKFANKRGKKSVTVDLFPNGAKAVVVFVVQISPLLTLLIL